MSARERRKCYAGSALAAIFVQYADERFGAVIVALGSVPNGSAPLRRHRGLSESPIDRSCVAVMPRRAICHRRRPLFVKREISAALLRERIDTDNVVGDFWFAHSGGVRSWLSPSF